MQQLPFENENNELVFFRAYGVIHRWTRRTFYSYVSVPRGLHGLMLVLCDHIRVEYPDDSVVLFDKGDLIYIPKGIYYSIRFLGDSEPLEVLMVNFAISGDLTTCDRIVKILSNADQGLAKPFYKMASYCMQANDHKYEIMGEFYRLLGEIKKQGGSTETSALAKSVQPAVEYISSHIGEPMYVSDLAKKCLLSESAFRKRFREIFGQTPGEYVTEKRLTKAAELLKSTDIPITTIASELGFYDNAYFYKLFKNKYKVTPSRYRDKDEAL